MSVVCQPTIDYMYGWGLYAWQAESPSGTVNRWHLWVANTSVGRKAKDRAAPFAHVILTRRYDCRLELLINTHQSTADVVLRKLVRSPRPSRRPFLARPDSWTGNWALYHGPYQAATLDAESYVAGRELRQPLTGVRDFYDNARAARKQKRAENLFDWLRESDWLLVPQILGPTSVPVEWPDPPAPDAGAGDPPQP